MTKILIAGATGLVGGHALLQALADDRIESVIAPTRRPLAKHPKLINPIFGDLLLPADAEWWAVDGVICTLGTTRAKAGSAEAFRAVDLDLQLAVARYSRAQGAQSFALTSSMGADAGSRFFYLRTKGELEAAVAQLDWPSLTIIRPGVILGDRDESRLSEQVTAVALRVLAPILPRRYRGNPAQDIARALLEGAVNGPLGHHVLDSGRLG